MLQLLISKYSWQVVQNINQFQFPKTVILKIRRRLSTSWKFPTPPLSRKISLILLTLPFLFSLKNIIVSGLWTWFVTRYKFLKVKVCTDSHNEHVDRWYKILTTLSALWNIEMKILCISSAKWNIWILCYEDQFLLTTFQYC